MRLKTFLAKDMREALEQVRAELGDDAVIVARETAKDGSVLVRAAIEDIEIPPQLAAQFAAQREANAPAQSGAKLMPFEENYRNRLVARLRTKGPEDAHAKRIAFDRSALISILHRNRMPDQMAPVLAEDAEKSGISDLALALASALDKRMKTQLIDVRDAKVLLLAGPHGSGKTTIAAKLAAHARMAGRKVRLIATDLAGAGHLARLETFGQHLDTDVIPVSTPAEFFDAIMKAKEADALAIADTAGFDPRAHEHWREFLRYAEDERVEIIGVMSATMDAEEARETARAIANLGASRTIVTGLDIARRKGTLATIALSPLALAQVTRSPFIAEGLEPLSPLALSRALIAAATETHTVPAKKHGKNAP